MKNYIIQFILILFISPFVANAQGWEKTYDNGHNESVRAADKTLDGGVIMAGISEDIQTGINYSYLIKTDADGILEWQHYDSVHIGTFVNTLDVLSTSDNNYLLSSMYGNNPPDNDYLVQKITADGIVLWENDMSNSSMEYVADMEETTDGGYIWIGNDTTTDNKSLGILKVDANGTEIWGQTYSLAYEPVYSISVKETANGDIIIVGYQGYAGGTQRAFAKRLDSNGLEIWSQEYDSAFDEFSLEILELVSGEFLIGGLRQITDSSIVTELTLMKIDSNGNQIWFQTYSNTVNHQFSGLAAATDGGFVISSYTTIDNGNNDIHLRKVDGNGTEIWSKTYGRNQADYSLGLMNTDDSGFYIAGSTERIDGTFDPYLIRTDSLGNSLTNEISGNIFHDDNENCILDNTETGLEQWLVQVSKDDIHYSMLSDIDGNYSFTVDTGTYEMQVSIVSPYWTLCQSDFTHTFTTTHDSILQNVAAQAIMDCPLMDVSIGTPFLRRCFDNIYYVQYCNYGTTIAENAYVEVTLDPFMTFVGADAPLIASVGDNYTFDLGNVDIGECGSFSIDIVLGDDQETCDSILLGATHCVVAHIFPDSICLPTVSWSGASVEVDAVCQGDSITFMMRNVGNAATQPNLEYLVIEDDVILYGGNYELEANEIRELTVATNGSTFRLEAEQEPNHPGMSMPSVTVEGCGDIFTSFSWGFTNIYSPDDGNPFIDIDCMQNIGAFDPNDKTGFPLGYGAENNIAIGQDIEYMIRFQNTGTDIAFNIEIIDTLLQHLDITSVRPGASSHPYDFNISGNGILSFSFDNIMLPDSTSNEPGSHGFVKFKVSQMPDLSIGTQINNSAAIYFDFNEPIITNTTLHTINETLFEQYTVSIYPVENPKVDISVYPNPFSNSTTISIDGMDIKDGILKLYDALGRLVRMESMDGNRLVFYKKDLGTGIYFFNVEEAGEFVSGGRLVLE